MFLYLLQSLLQEQLEEGWTRHEVGNPLCILDRNFTVHVCVVCALVVDGMSKLLFCAVCTKKGAGIIVSFLLNGVRHRKELCKSNLQPYILR